MKYILIELVKKSDVIEIEYDTNCKKQLKESSKKTSIMPLFLSAFIFFASSAKRFLHSKTLNFKTSASLETEIGSAYAKRTASILAKRLNELELLAPIF